MKPIGPGCARRALCLLLGVAGALAATHALGQPTAPSVLRDLPYATPALRYGNPNAPLVLTVTDTARRGAMIFAVTTLLPLVDQYPGVLALQWTLATRGTASDTAPASALLDAAAQHQAWCYVRALAAMNGPSSNGSGDRAGEDADGLSRDDLLAAAGRCGMDATRTALAYDGDLYEAAVQPLRDASRGIQRLALDGVPIRGTLGAEIAAAVARWASGQAPMTTTIEPRQPLIGRSRLAYESVGATALRMTSVTSGRAALPPQGVAMATTQAPTQRVGIYCVMDAKCQALFEELSRLIHMPQPLALVVSWVPLVNESPLVAEEASDVPERTLRLTCAARRGASPSLLLEFAAQIETYTVPPCVDRDATADAHKVIQGYTALALRRGVRHDLAVSINGRMFPTGMSPTTLRALLTDERSRGLFERLTPWLR